MKVRLRPWGNGNGKLEKEGNKEENGVEGGIGWKLEWESRNEDR